MRALLFAFALTGCQSVAGLGDPVELAPVDSAVAETSIDAAIDSLSETEAPTSTAMMLYRSTSGEAAFIDLSTDGRITQRSVTHLPAGLTHFAALEGNKLLSYDAATGLRTISKVDPSAGTFATITQDTSPGFSAFAAHDKGRLLISYRKEGTLRLDKLIGTAIGKLGELSGAEYAGFDTLVSTREGPFLLYDSVGPRTYIGTWHSAPERPAMPNDIQAGIAPVATVFSSHVFLFGRTMGFAAFTQLSDKGTDLDLGYWNDGAHDDAPSIKKDWSHIVGTPKTLLFYRASDGALVTATIVSDDFVMRFLDLTPTPAPTIGTGWTHIVSME